jgi:flagellar hook-basal body complex protein FliE
MNISNISGLPLAPPSAAAGGVQGAEQSFKDLMLDALGEVNGMQLDADKAVKELLTGQGDANMAEVFTAVQKADMSFRMVLQIRNKLMQAYQEIKDIRV